MATWQFQNPPLPQGFIEVPPHDEDEIPNDDGGIFLMLRGELSGPPTVLLIDCCYDHLRRRVKERLEYEQEAETGVTHIAYKSIIRNNHGLQEYAVSVIMEAFQLRLS